MNKNIDLTILTKEKEFFSGKVISIITKTINGKIGILPNREPITAALEPTISQIENEDGSVVKFFSSTGLLKVDRETVLMLYEACEYPEDIDLERAERAKERAQKRLASKDEKVDIGRARNALLRSLIRIKTKDIKKDI
ncbi:ATP synthase F1 subunit epsilon [Clostridium sp. DL1XJH146]